MIRLLKAFVSYVTALVLLTLALGVPIVAGSAGILAIIDQLRQPEPYRAGIISACMLLLVGSVYLIIVGRICGKAIRFRMRARFEHRRHQLGLCVKCGYDLQGGHERCPECGERLYKRKRAQPVN